MFVAVARITLSIPDSGSLKSKRHIVHKVVDKVKSRFNVSIAEVADHELWQRATLGVAAVANEHAFARECVDKVVRFVEELYVAPVLSCVTEVIPLGRDLYGEDDRTSFGSAARGTSRTLAEAEADVREQRPREGRGREVRDARAHPGPRPAEDERQRAIEELRVRLRRERQQAAARRDDTDEDQ